MKYYELQLDQKLRFMSLHTIDFPQWRPLQKLLRDFDLIISANSTVHIICDSTRHVLKPGEAFLAIPGQVVCIAQETTPREGVFVLHFECGGCAAITAAQALGLQGGNVSPILGGKLLLPVVSAAVQQSITPLIQEIIEEMKFKDYAYEAKLDLCLLNILFILHRQAALEAVFNKNQFNYTTANAYVRSVINFLHANIANDISIADVERQLNRNYDYINSVFKYAMGSTIMLYLNDIRMTRAKELLESTDLKLVHISRMVGLPDALYFSRRFKQFTGLSPSHYRKQTQHTLVVKG
jgi:AraC-like DNA-binding protein